MIKTYSLHKITEANNFSFCPAQYSRFKFGDGAAARTFGASLAEGFIRECLQPGPVHEQIVVVSSPFSFIPTATFAMKDHFVFTLNRWLAENGYPVVQEAKVHRTITYKEDYGELNAEQRLSLIGNDLFHIDSTFFRGKTVLFLDDIRITGSHERMIMKMVNEYKLDNPICLLYFAELVNGAIHPNVENKLNYHSVKSLIDLNDIIGDPGFRINTRIVKYILNANDGYFPAFMRSQRPEFVQDLYNMAIGNGYHLIESYRNNLNFIREHLFLKQTKFVFNGN